MESYRPPQELIVIEDDDRLRNLLAVLLDGAPGFYCQRTYVAAEPFFAELSTIQGAIILMDIDLGNGMNGIEAVRRLYRERPDLTVVMLTIQEDSTSVFSALCAGAIGYLIKGIPPVQLISALEEAAAGGAPMSPKIARRVVATFHQGPPSPLSNRETEVLRLLCQGESYRSIAELLFISGHTVRSHIKNIYEKLHVHSRAQAVAKALRDRLIE